MGPALQVGVSTYLSAELSVSSRSTYSAMQRGLQRALEMARKNFGLEETIRSNDNKSSPSEPAKQSDDKSNDNRREKNYEQK